MWRLFAAIIALILFGNTQAAKVQVLPVDGAKFLVGGRFDFRVELSELKGNPKDVRINLNGQSAEQYFGKPLAQSSAEGGIANLMVREVSFARTGKVQVQVSGSDDSGAFSHKASYTIVRASTFGPKAKNVIVFIGDGMGWNTVTAARIVKTGITSGKANDLLEMEKAHSIASIATSGLDSLVTDSANSASAYATGHKTANNGLGVYPDNTKDTLDDPRQELITEMLKRSKGMSIGLVSTSYGSDATPAAWIAHTRRRGDYSQIAEQMLDSPARPDVLLFGGLRDFIPKSVTGSRRQNERNMIEEFQKQGYQYVSNAEELKNAKPGKMLGLFSELWMNSYLDRVQFKKPEVLGRFPNQPLIWDMSMKAIESLSQNPNGFFLMVEASGPDVLQHALDWQRATWDAIEMDVAIGKAKAWAAQRGDTLIIVTADHAHSNSTYGTFNSTKAKGPGDRDAVGIYEGAPFPTYQKKLDQNGIPMPATDIGLAIGFGAAPDTYENYLVREEPNVPAVMQDNKAVPNPKYQGGVVRTGNLPTNSTSGVHTVDPIPLFAWGPGAFHFRGVMDNTEVFFSLANALGLDLSKTTTASK